MALLTLGELIDEVIDEMAGKEQAPIVRALNKVIRRLHTKTVKPQRLTFTSKQSVTTGTVATTLGSTALTFSSGVLSASDPFTLVQISGDDTWYVCTRNAADTAGVLSSAWPVASDATATFTLAYPTVTLPATVGEVLKVARVGTGELEFEHAGQIPDSTGIPQRWGPYSHDDSAASPNDDLARVVLTPAPTDPLAYSFWYKSRTPKIATDAATSATIPFSDLWHEAIVQGTLFFCWKQEADKEKALLAEALYERALIRTGASEMPGATIPPRRRMGRLYAYEERPVESA